MSKTLARPKTTAAQASEKDCSCGGHGKDAQAEKLPVGPHKNHASAWWEAALFWVCWGALALLLPLIGVKVLTG